jgi:hypothetical protein
MLVHGLLHVANSDVELAHLRSEGAPSDDERNPNDEDVASPYAVPTGMAHSPLPTLAQAKLLAPCWYMD